MPNADDGMRHVALELIDEEKKIAAMIPPACCKLCVSSSVADVYWDHLPFGPSSVSFSTLLWPWLAMSAIQMLRMLQPDDCKLS